MSAGADGLAVAGRQRLGWLLAGAHGYTVRASDGTRLGRLAWLTYDLDDRCPAGLRVQARGWGGLWASESWEIGVERVLAVLPRRRSVIVMAERGGGAPGRHGTGAPGGTVRAP